MSLEVTLIEKQRLQLLQAALEKAERALSNLDKDAIEQAQQSIRQAAGELLYTHLQPSVSAEVIESPPIGPSGETLKAAFLHDKNLPAGAKLFTMSSVHEIVHAEINQYRRSWLRTEMELANAKEELLQTVQDKCKQWISQDTPEDLKEPYWNGYQQGVVDCLSEIAALREQSPSHQLPQQEDCDICAEGVGTLHCELSEVERDGHKGLVRTYYRVCNHCGSDYAGGAEARLNKAEMLAFWERIRRSK